MSDVTAAIEQVIRTNGRWHGKAPKKLVWVRALQHIIDKVNSGEYPLCFLQKGGLNILLSIHSDIFIYLTYIKSMFLQIGLPVYDCCYSSNLDVGSIFLFVVKTDVRISYGNGREVVVEGIAFVNPKILSFPLFWNNYIFFHILLN
jgi:hypothetical protein